MEHNKCSTFWRAQWIWFWTDPRCYEAFTHVSASEKKTRDPQWKCGGNRANTQQVILSCVIGPEGHNGTKRGVKQYWNVWIRSLLSRPLTLTYGDTLQPVSLRQLNDKWSCLSANICYSSAAWTGTARPAGFMALAATFKADPIQLSRTITANQQPNTVIWDPSTASTSSA